MQKAPFRTYDDIIKTEPTIYRLTEAALHYGQSIKEVINEKFGDGESYTSDVRECVLAYITTYHQFMVVVVVRHPAVPHHGTAPVT